MPLEFCGEIARPGVQHVAGRILTRKYPLPWMARSSWLPVVCIVPCDWLVWVLCTRTPVPSRDSGGRSLSGGVQIARQLLLPVQQVLEIEAVPFERGGLHVGQIVGDDVQLGLHRRHAGGGVVKHLNRHGYAFKILAEQFVEHPVLGLHHVQIGFQVPRGLDHFHHFRGRFHAGNLQVPGRHVAIRGRHRPECRPGRETCFLPP